MRRSTKYSLPEFSGSQIWCVSDYETRLGILGFCHTERPDDCLEMFTEHNEWICEQDRQCTCNLTSRSVRATIVKVEKQWVLHILSVYL